MRKPKLLQIQQGEPKLTWRDPGWMGVVSSIVIGGGESQLQGEGLDGSTQLAKETHARQSWIGHRCANLPARNSENGKSQQATSLSGSLSTAQYGDAAPSLEGLEKERCHT